MLLEVQKDLLLLPGHPTPDDYAGLHFCSLHNLPVMLGNTNMGVRNEMGSNSLLLSIPLLPLLSVTQELWRRGPFSALIPKLSRASDLPVLGLLYWALWPLSSQASCTCAYKLEWDPVAAVN